MTYNPFFTNGKKKSTKLISTQLIIGACRLQDFWKSHNNFQVKQFLHAFLNMC